MPPRSLWLGRPARSGPGWLDQPGPCRAANMIGKELRSLVLASQGESGAFPAIAHPPSGPVPDENAFVTALVVNLLSRVAPDPKVEKVRQRGLDFLLRCERPDRPGAFSFYPSYGHPPWIGEVLPADADDTALCR